MEKLALSLEVAVIFKEKREKTGKRSDGLTSISLAA
jgi:hypothetical protein